MLITKKLPARLAPSEGERLTTMNMEQATKRVAPSQDFELSEEAQIRVDVQVSAMRLSSGRDIFQAPKEHLITVINYLWCPEKPIGLPDWKLVKELNVRKKGGLYEYWVEDGGNRMRLGTAATLTSQAKFRAAFLEATELHSRIVIPPHAPDEWLCIVRCLIKLTELRGDTHG